jgi:hypothetical protein
MKGENTERNVKKGVKTLQPQVPPAEELWKRVIGG